MDMLPAHALPIGCDRGTVEAEMETTAAMHLRKDKSLDELAEIGNVAQFVSFTPGSSEPEQAYARVAGHAPNASFGSAEEAMTILLAASADLSVNIRSYTPENPRSREFVYGVKTVTEIVDHLRRLSAEGLHSIANETIDINDGGVSGVAQAGIIEFAPDDTPRCVEKGDTASLPLKLGLTLLETVYGFRPQLGPQRGRTEFSLHPKPCGWRQTQTLLWEHEEDYGATGQPTLAWPNRFSRHIGDKVFGLLIAHLSGEHVPETLCISRRVAPFRFGQTTTTSETWIRTSPKQQEPGKFTTHRGWLDPYALMAAEDSDGTRIASILAQRGVDPLFSGASLVDASGTLIIEGVAGSGDQFMLGKEDPYELPKHVRDDVIALHDRLKRSLGSVRTEWVHDGNRVWVVQMHRGATSSLAHVLVPGERQLWVGFEVAKGLEDLRELLREIDDESGIKLVGQVGMTSHIADLVRQSGVPTRIVPAM